MTVKDRFLMFRKLFQKLTVTHITGHSQERCGTVMNTDAHTVRRMSPLSWIVENRISSPFTKGCLDNRNRFLVWNDAFQFFSAHQSHHFVTTSFSLVCFSSNRSSS